MEVHTIGPVTDRHPQRFCPRIAGAPGGAKHWLATLASAAAPTVLVLAAVLSGGAPAAVVPPPNAHEHWAFHAPKSPTLPEVNQLSWVRTDVDRFILARLETAGVTPAPPADPRTLIRRMSYDMIGLPPSPEEVDAFAAAAAADRDAAIAGLIDRLLSLPRYGERWGRHWLDVARYSDTKGYVYAREERRFVHAPAYRDWVIRALNDDMPADRFLLLQLAADQLVPADSPDLAAMGFLTGGRRFIGVTHDIIDDRIDVVTRGTMALTVACARCHDHKYDPVPTADYYSLYGVFRDSDDRLVPLAESGDAELEKRRSKLAETMAVRRAEAGARLRSRVSEYLAAQLELKKYPEEGFDQILTADDLIPASVRRWRDYLLLAGERPHPIFGPWLALAAVPAESFADQAGPALAAALAQPGLNPRVAAAFAEPPATHSEAAERYGRIFQEAEAGGEADGAPALREFLSDPGSPTVVPDTGIVNNETYFPTSAIEELWKLQGEVDRRLLELATPAALVLAERKPGPNPRVFVRGLPSSLGPSVPRQFLEVLAGSNRQPFRQGTGRLELARAIASAENPLTARVFVNRVWQHHFGTGLVRTPSDFGLRAERPSHPELLDWLALRFVADGWSLKTLHRLILSSATYQQASANPQADPSRDPDDRLLARFPVRRLDFEQLRDTMLQAAGVLDTSRQGPSRDVLDPANTRRTVYAMVDRQFLPGTFRTFDFANPDLHVAVRHETTVPQQALFFLNGPFAAERARQLARTAGELPPDRRVDWLHQRLYQRPASAGEIEAALAFVRLAEAEAAPAAPAAAPTPWRYGTGSFNESTQRVDGFAPLAHATGAAWQGAAAWPGGETGWAQLTAAGGHPGNTRAQACVRRWISPVSGSVRVTGVLRHEPSQGDGVRGFVVSSRHGVIAQAHVHASEAPMAAESVTVEPGDCLDFVVDIGGTLDSDQFLWEPVVSVDERRWHAAGEFSAPAPAPVHLTPWEQYAHVLLLANEFAFVD